MADERDATGFRLDELSLRFIVRPGEPRVRIEAQSPAGVLDLGASGIYDVILFLARCRLIDREAGVPESEAGWRLDKEVVAALKLTDLSLFVRVLRSRYLFRQHGVLESRGIVTRRRDSGKIRLGVEALSIDDML